MEITLEVTLEQAIKVCEEHGYIAIKNRKLSPNDLLAESEIKRLSAKINNVTVSIIEGQSRGEYAVFARWLVAYYFLEFSELSLATIGFMINRDHSTIIHIRKNICNPFMDGWRKKNKRDFEIEVNNIHESLGLKFMFK